LRRGGGSLVAVAAGDEVRREHDSEEGGKTTEPEAGAGEVADDDQPHDREQDATDDLGGGSAVHQPGGLGLVVPLLGDEEPADGIEQQARAAEDRERDEHDAEDQRVDVEVAAQAARDAGDLAIADAAAQRGTGRRCGGLARLGGVSRVVHGSIVDITTAAAYPETPLPHPDRTLT
jgi:hypothetical protein